jgi:hypothetical protein
MAKRYEAPKKKLIPPTRSLSLMTEVSHIIFTTSTA